MGVEASLKELVTGEENHTDIFSMQAIEGIATLKIRGMLKGHEVLVILVSGSLHLFFDENAAK